MQHAKPSLTTRNGFSLDLKIQAWMETRLDNMTKRSKKANCGPQLLAPCMDGAEYDADNIAPEPQAAPQQAQIALPGTNQMYTTQGKNRPKLPVPQEGLESLSFWEGARELSQGAGVVRLWK
ncbi:hypothetical protein WJX84_005534 [Apatococcus fuscideae]|uniref:Uncharacterized protein n=1 Tax=Apatococcus fuscideae TaxID=2026836 RepID=A0AAW1SSC3_9CHLO